jgi:hypothetical protein
MLLKLLMVLTLVIATCILVGFTFHKVRELAFGLVPPWDPAYPRTTQSAVLRISVVVSPWIVFIRYMLSHVTGYTTMPEFQEPWYLPYSTWSGMISMFIFFPATWAAKIVDQPLFGFFHWLASISWTFLLSWTLWLLCRPRSSQSENAT